MRRARFLNVPMSQEQSPSTPATAIASPPGALRITFAGEELADFVSLSPDDRLKLFVPTPTQRHPSNAQPQSCAFFVLDATEPDRANLLFHPRFQASRALHERLDTGTFLPPGRPKAKTPPWGISQAARHHFMLPISRSESAPSSISVVSSTRAKRPSASSSANRYTSCTTWVPSRLVMCTRWRSA